MKIKHLKFLKEFRPDTVEIRPSKLICFYKADYLAFWINGNDIAAD